MTSPPRSPLLLLCGYAVLYSIALIFTSTKCDMTDAPPPPPPFPPPGGGAGGLSTSGAWSVASGEPGVARFVIAP